jgi:RPA family protein
MTNEELLQKFGQILISEVRDEAIDKYEMIAAGTMKSAPAIELHNKLSQFNEDQLSVVRQTVVSSIDDVIHNFLWMLEQHEDDVDLLYSADEDTDKENIRELSDGLSGEIYTEDGWIAKYSNHKENY